MRKDGSLVPVSISSAPISVDGQLVGYVTLYKDITQRKRAEETLRESEEKYRNLFETAKDVILTVDLFGNITSINKAVEEYGWKREEIIGKNMLELMPKETWPSLLLGITQITEGRLLEGEMELATPNGRRITEYKSNPITKNGKIVGIQVIARDITERKRAEEALKDSEERFRAIVENAPFGYYRVGKNGLWQYVNPVWERMHGFSSKEVIGKPFEITQPEDTVKQARELVKRTLSGETITGEFGRLTKEGKTAYHSLSIQPVKHGKEIVAIEGFINDITERKKMEERLKQYSEHLEEFVQKRTEELLESEIRYSALVEEAGDGVGIIQDEKIVFANKKCAEILDYSVDEGIGRSFLEMIDEKHRKFIKERYTQRMVGEKIPATYETLLISKTGKKVPVEITATLIQYQGLPADLVIIRDLRERKRVEEQHLKLEKLAAIGELATMVAHDLRNPLTSIRNASFYIKNTCPSQASSECKSAVEMLGIIEQETLFANDIINDLLDFAAKKPLQTSRQNINTIIEKSLKKTNIPKNVEVGTNFTKNPIVTVDEKQLERVFLNIAKNAAQAMPNGGKLTITTKKTKHHVEIIFTDTGIGIPPENIGKISLPLFTTKAKGIGMGLAICKRIVEEHHGSIDVHSKVGKGTSFTIKLPKKEADNQ